MAVRVIHENVEYNANMEAAWNATKDKPHDCYICKSSVKVEEPQDIHIISNYFLRAYCPVCDDESGIVVIPYVNKDKYLSTSHQGNFVRYLIENGATQPTLLSSIALVVLPMLVILGMIALAWLGSVWLS